MNILPYPTNYVQQLCLPLLQVDDVCIDATLGNGYDTLFLAQSVKENGRVFAFDIQQQAITNSKTVLEKHSCLSQCSLFHAGHENMDEHIPSSFYGKVAVILFNLGYLPGSDKSIVTKHDTTITALQKSLLYLRLNGLVAITIYSGHDGGKEEAEAINDWAKGLDCRQYQVISYKLLNRLKPTPYVLFIEKFR